jgi:hypothetical protein
MLIQNEQLQQVADRKESQDIKDIADHTYEFDTNDPYDCRSLVEAGLDVGLKLAKLAQRRRQQLINRDPVVWQLAKPKVRVFLINFPDYVDDDGLAIFVGTEDQVKGRLDALPDREDS